MPDDREHRSWSETYREVLATVVKHGDLVDPGPSLSVGGSRPSLEVLNHAFQVRDPTDRLLHGRPFNLAAAVGRFVWMMTGSNRVEDIAFYDARAERFSDDGFTVPGSSDGARLLNPRPGLNQLSRIIELLQTERETRRAVGVIYQPEDAGRASRDIPCHIAVAYNIRGGVLHASTVMRSCNAARVLPYDFFLFSLLAEVIAGTVGCRVGPYTQFTVSMHVYDDDLGYAREIVDVTPTGAEPPAMPEMPRGDVMGAIRDLARTEQELRAQVPSASPDRIRQYVAELAQRHDPYWTSFAQVLLLHAAKRSLPPEDLAQLRAMQAEHVFPAFLPYL